MLGFKKGVFCEILAENFYRMFVLKAFDLYNFPEIFEKIMTLVVHS